MKIAVVFDGPPGPESGRFVEVENERGEGIRVGRWEESTDGCWRLWIEVLGAEGSAELVVALRANIERAKAEGFETDGAVPPGDAWARAYALDMAMLLDSVEDVVGRDFTVTEDIGSLSELSALEAYQRGVLDVQEALAEKVEGAR